MSDELPEELQRWTAKRRSALIVSIIKGETSVQEAARTRPDSGRSQGLAGEVSPGSRERAPQ